MCSDLFDEAAVSGLKRPPLRLWHGKTGKFVATLRGHVGAVYQLAWSSDSRLLASGSKDSTVKVWEVKTRKLKEDLPGHADEVFSVDWSPDGQSVFLPATNGYLYKLNIGMGPVAAGS